MRFLWIAWAGVATAWWAWIAVAWFRGVRRLPDVRDYMAAPSGGPLVSVIVAARDEERSLPRALCSLLAQDYSPLEVIVVDDRSTDRTPEILFEIAARQPNLQTLAVAELPEGWLGKNHALALGASVARGEWLLFTDADVVFSRDCIGRAVALATNRRLDHLTMFPAFTARGLFLRSFVLSFFLLFCLYTRLWRAERPTARESVGVGAFNLVLRSAYQAVGTHRAISLRPDDDLALGALLKHGGFRQAVGFGQGLLEIEWYPSLGDAFRGVEKNALVPFRYRVDLVILGSVLALGVHVVPMAGCLLAGGVGAVAFSVATALQVIVCVDEARSAGHAAWYGILHPLGTILVVVATLRAAWLAKRRRGVQWRGTWYPLERLRRAASGSSRRQTHGGDRSPARLRTPQPTGVVGRNGKRRG